MIILPKVRCCKYKGVVFEFSDLRGRSHCCIYFYAGTIFYSIQFIGDRIDTSIHTSTTFTRPCNKTDSLNYYCSSIILLQAKSVRCPRKKTGSGFMIYIFLLKSSGSSCIRFFLFHEVVNVCFVPAHSIPQKTGFKVLCVNTPIRCGNQ